MSAEQPEITVIKQEMLDPEEMLGEIIRDIYNERDVLKNREDNVCINTAAIKIFEYEKSHKRKTMQKETGVQAGNSQNEKSLRQCEIRLEDSINGHRGLNDQYTKQKGGAVPNIPSCLEDGIRTLVRSALPSLSAERLAHLVGVIMKEQPDDLRDLRFFVEEDFVGELTKIQARKLIHFIKEMSVSSITKRVVMRRKDDSISASQLTSPEARTHLKKPENYTDLESTDAETLGRREKVKKKRIPERVPSSSDSEEAEIDDSPSFTPPHSSKQVFTVPGEDFLVTEDVLAECQSEPLLENNLSPQIITLPSLQTSDPLLGNNFSPQIITLCSSLTSEEPSISCPTDSHSQKADSHSESQHQSPSHSKRRKTDSGTTVTIPAQAFHRLVRSNQIVKANQRVVMDMLDLLVKRDHTHSDAMESILPLLPLKNEVDVASLEVLLLERTTLQEMINYLKGIGGSSVDIMVRHILRRLFTNKCANDYSFLGQRGKRALRHLNIYKAILGAVKLNTTLREVYEIDVDNSIKNWLRHAKARMKGAPEDGNTLC